jgi:hypothetical protein
MRSGDEPTHARSPLRLRAGLAAFGLATAIAGMVVFAYLHSVGWVLACGVLALLSVVDLVVISAHIRGGAHYQPGPDVPPYRPVSDLNPDAAERAVLADREPVPIAVRRRRYTLLIGLALLLVVLAWTWVRTVSPTAAVLMSAVAMILLPVAAIVANAGSGINRQ